MPKGAKKRARLKLQLLLQQQGHPDDDGDTNAGNGNCNGRDDDNNALSRRDGDPHLRIPPKVCRGPVDVNEDSMEISEEMVTPGAVAAEVPVEHAMKADVTGYDEVTVDAFPLETTGPEREGKVDEAEVEVHSMVVQEPQVNSEASDLKEVAKLHATLESELKVDLVVVVEETPVAPEVQEPEVKGAGATVVLNEPETSSGNVVVKDSAELSQSQEAVDVHSTEVTASTSVQEEAVSKLKQVRELLHKEDNDDVAVLCDNRGIAATLGNGGVILALVETNTGFAIFAYDGVNLFKKDALQNIWVDFANHTVAKETVCLLKFCVSEHKIEAIKSNGVSKELATMIRDHIKPGQKLAVENKDYQKAIENDMKISCLSDDNVDELMWGLKVHMPYLVPEESLLKEDGWFSMSKGMKQLLESHCFILEANMMVTREIINLAGVLHKCVSCVNEHESFLRRGAEHLKRISHIDTQGWDLMKLAAALRLICLPEGRTPEAPSVNSVSKTYYSEVKEGCT